MPWISPSSTLGPHSTQMVTDPLQVESPSGGRWRHLPAGQSREMVTPSVNARTGDDNPTARARDLRPLDCPPHIYSTTWRHSWGAHAILRATSEQLLKIENLAHYLKPTFLDPH